MGDSPDYHLSPPSFINQQNNHYNLSMLYCGFFVVTTAGLILAIYHCLAMNWCSDYPPAWPGSLESIGNDQSFDPRKVTKLDSMLFKYKKHQEQEDEECVVCLSVFEEGEDVRKLVRCKHSFHAPCIDMWLFSHFNCPLCRAPVGGGLDGGNASLAQNSGSDFSEVDNNPV